LKIIENSKRKTTPKEAKAIVEKKKEVVWDYVRMKK
jgi:hypothetical protein